jgi:hypothetical protein
MKLTTQDEQAASLDELRARIEQLERRLSRPLSQRNLLHNGKLEVAQRAVTVTGISGAGATYNTVDRWRLYRAAMGSAVVREDLVLDGPAGTPFVSSWKLTVTTADASINSAHELNFAQGIEAINCTTLMKGTAAARPITVSFWVKASIPGTYWLDLWEPTNVRDVSAKYTINAANTWEQKVITFPGDTSGYITPGTGQGIWVQFMLGAGSGQTGAGWTGNWSGSATYRAAGQTNLIATVNSTFQVTGVQVEAGAYATPFEHRDFADELQLCRRYFRRMGGGSAYDTLAQGHLLTTGVGYFFIPVDHMRAAPNIANTLTMSNYQIIDNFNAAYTPASINIDGSYSFRTAVLQVAGTFTNGRSGWLRSNNTTAGVIDLSCDM